MAFSVYSSMEKKYQHKQLGHVMTGFGPVAEVHATMKSSKNVLNASVPPYILAPSNETLDAEGGKSGDNSRVLFCSYCLSEDQRLLLVSVVYDSGEVSTVFCCHIGVFAVC